MSPYPATTGPGGPEATSAPTPAARRFALAGPAAESVAPIRPAFQWRCRPWLMNRHRLFPPGSLGFTTPGTTSRINIRPGSVRTETDQSCALGRLLTTLSSKHWICANSSGKSPWYPRLDASWPRLHARLKQHELELFRGEIYRH